MGKHAPHTEPLENTITYSMKQLSSRRIPLRNFPAFHFPAATFFRDLPALIDPRDAASASYPREQKGVSCRREPGARLYPATRPWRSHSDATQQICAAMARKHESFNYFRAACTHARSPSSSGRIHCNFRDEVSAAELFSGVRAIGKPVPSPAENNEL